MQLSGSQKPYPRADVRFFAPQLHRSVKSSIMLKASTYSTPVQLSRQLALRFIPDDYGPDSGTDFFHYGCAPPCLRREHSVDPARGT